MTVKLSASKKYFEKKKNYSLFQVSMGEERKAFQLASVQQ